MWNEGTSVRFLLFLLRVKTKDSKKQEEDEEKKGNKSTERVFHCEMETLGSESNQKKRIKQKIVDQVMMSM